MKRSVYVLVCVIIVILLITLGIFAFRSNEKKENNEKENETVLNEQKDNKQKEETNVQTNEMVANEITNSIANETVQNVIENTTSSETLEESPKTAEEKAIGIVKQDWKEEGNVVFSAEGMDANGNYRITVRDDQTQALAFYTVNITNGTFTKREMN